MKESPRPSLLPAPGSTHLPSVPVDYEYEFLITALEKLKLG